jgi:hypothetical protein
LAAAEIIVSKNRWATVAFAMSTLSVNTNAPSVEELTVALLLEETIKELSIPSSILACVEDVSPSNTKYFINGFANSS